MGNETILYYVTEESITGTESPAKTYFWKRMKLRAFAMEEDGLSVVAVLVPGLLKGWKKEKLLRRIQEAMAEFPGYLENAELIIQPALSQMLMARKERSISMQSDEFSIFYWGLAERLLRKKINVVKGLRPGKNHYSEEAYHSGKSFRPLKAACPESVILLLGNSFFPEEQMRRFSEMMQPYFSYINHLTILYEPELAAGRDSDVEQPVNSDLSMNMDIDMKRNMDIYLEQERLEEAIRDYTDIFEYEYGLVSQVWRGREYHVGSQIKGKGGLTLCFDCGYQGTIPLRALKKGDIYLDVFSSEKKETLFRRKKMEITYLSPLKYLDTMVKSGYDKLVN